MAVANGKLLPGRLALRLIRGKGERARPGDDPRPRLLLEKAARRAICGLQKSVLRFGEDEGCRSPAPAAAATVVAGAGMGHDETYMPSEITAALRAVPFVALALMRDGAGNEDPRGAQRASGGRGGQICRAIAWSRPSACDGDRPSAGMVPSAGIMRASER